VVTLNCRDIYLGRHGTRESRAKFDRVIAERLASGRGDVRESNPVGRYPPHWSTPFGPMSPVRSGR